MWQAILALSIAWGLAWLAKRLIGGTDAEALGLGLILLPVAMSMVMPSSKPVMAGSVLVGLAVFVLANRRRRTREREAGPAMAQEGTPGRRGRHYRGA